MSNSVRVFHNGNLVATYGTIQAAIDAPSTLAGSIIIASAGTYAEHVVISKAVTLVGANDGVDGAEARGPETVITGGVKVAANGVTVGGVEISGSYDTAGTPDITVPPRIGLLIGGADATIENSVLTGDAVSSRPFGTSGSATGLAFDHNLVQDWTQAAYLRAAARVRSPTTPSPTTAAASSASRCPRSTSRTTASAGRQGCRCRRRCDLADLRGG